MKVSGGGKNRGELPGLFGFCFCWGVGGLGGVGGVWGLLFLFGLCCLGCWCDLARKQETAGSLGAPRGEAR